MKLTIAVITVLAAAVGVLFYSLGRGRDHSAELHPEFDPRREEVRDYSAPTPTGLDRTPGSLVRPTGRTEVDSRSEQGEAILRLTIKSEDGGSLSAGLMDLQLLDAEGEQLRLSETWLQDNLCEFRVPGGRYSVRVVLHGQPSSDALVSYCPGKIEIEVQEGAVHEETISMAQGGCIALILGESINISEAKEEQIDEIYDRPFTVRVVQSAGKGRTEFVRFSYRAPGRLYDPNNEIGGAWSIASNMPSIPAGIESISSPLCPGEYLIRASCIDGREAEGLAKVTAGGTAFVHLEIQ